MNIARIVSITPAGKPWTNMHGTLYPFTVAFDDGRAGETNAKTNPPGYRVGEVCGYDVTGQTPQGMDKFKVTRNPDPTKGRFTGQPEAEHMPGDPDPVPPARKYVQGGHQTPLPIKSPIAPKETALPVNLPHPACVGACVNKAVEVWVATIGKDQPWGDSSADTVHRIASELIEVHAKLERGEFAGQVPF